MGLADLSLSVGAPYAVGSCARAPGSAYASTATSLCDLVDSTAPTTVVCTLRATSTGAVDLSAYCGGSTPAAKCATLTGGVCNISKVYDPVGSHHWTQTTAVNQPTLSFAALNGLPGINCGAATNTSLLSATITISQPVNMATVAKRNDAGVTVGTFIGNPATAGRYGIYPRNANQWAISAGTELPYGTSLADLAFHAAQGSLNGASSSIVGDGGTPTTGTAGTAGFTAQALSICRAATVSVNAIVMEVAVWNGGGAFTSGDESTVNTNQHGSNGYAF